MPTNSTISFSLDIESDRDIIQWLSRQSNRSESIRKAIRAQMDNSTTLEELRGDIAELTRLVKSGVVVSQEHNSPRHTSEPQEAALALAALARM